MKLNKTELQGKVIDWLIKGDPSIRWQVMKDLLGKKERVYQIERNKISTEGWGKKLLSKQSNDGMWADSLYHHKWI